MKFLRLFGVLLLGALLLAAGTGCKERTKPGPKDTLPGGASNRADWVAGSNVETVPGTDPSLGTTIDPLDAENAAMGLETRAGTEGTAAGNEQRGLLPSVYFDFDSQAVKASERGKLQQAAEYLKANPTHKLVLEGHCDWRGTTEYNLTLGERRAAAAVTYLVGLGVAANRLETRSLGDQKATVEGDATAMAQDRRVDLLVVLPTAP